MADLSSNAPPNQVWNSVKRQKVWIATALILLLVAVISPMQATKSFRFVIDALIHTGPYLVLSIGIAAWATATGADNLIAKAFQGSPALMIFLAALAGGLSPFCSCGVIPLIAALLTMGVPLSAVMAFWLASPVMDPSMFLLTYGVLGLDFAVAKTLAAIGLGVAGGFIVLALAGTHILHDALREGVGNGGCGAAKIRNPKPVVWRFWEHSDRIEKFGKEMWKTTMFLAQWLALAFLIESLMLAYVPAETITATLGGSGIGPIAIATLVGVPAYLNGYAALPLISGLLDQGMAAGAGLAFLVAGGVTSLPAAIAVWALVKVRVFALYVTISLGGAFLIGLAYQLWTMI